MLFTVLLFAFSFPTINAHAIHLEHNLARRYSEVSHINLKRSTARPSPHLVGRGQNWGVNVSLKPPSDQYRENFEAEITIGAQTVRAVIDTGSATTWFLTQNVDCRIPGTLEPANATECGYHGPRFDANSPSFQIIPDKHFNESYGNGESVNGPLGYETVSFGGINNMNQTIGLATYAAVDYPGPASGLIGLAHSRDTEIYPGNNVSSDVRCILGTAPSPDCNTEHIPSFLQTIFDAKLAKPVIALALSRNTTQDANGGVLTIGGIPRLNDPKINATGLVASTPIENVGNTTMHTLYAINATAIEFDGASDSDGAGQYIVDSGTAPNILPKAISEKLLAAFNPPAQYSDVFEGYLVYCNATAPTFGVEIGGQVVYQNPSDLIMHAAGLPEGVCASGIQAGLSNGQSLLILGAVWMKSLLAVFDIRASEAHFVSRLYYES